MFFSDAGVTAELMSVGGQRMVDSVSRLTTVSDVCVVSYDSTGCRVIEGCVCCLRHYHYCCISDGCVCVVSDVTTRLCIGDCYVCRGQRCMVCQLGGRD